MLYPLKACLFEEGPISDVLLLNFLTYYHSTVIQNARSRLLIEKWSSYRNKNYFGSR